MVAANADRFADFFFPVYKRYLDEEDNDLRLITNKKLAEACRPITVEMFLSRAIGYGVVTGFLLWITMVTGTWVAFSVLGLGQGAMTGLTFDPIVASFINAIKTPALILFSGVFSAIAGFTAGFFAPIGNLYLQSNGRAREIGILMPDAVAFMHALSIGGMNQIQIFEALARADETYGEVSQEFAIILQETRYFGIDYRTAIRNRSVSTPDDEFGQFLTDMLSVLNSGGDLQGFLDEQRRKFMRESTQKQEQSLETLELFGEMYMTLSMFPLLLIILIVIMSMVGNSMDLYLFGIVYGLIPIISVGFIVMIGTVKHDDPGDGILRPDEGQAKVDKISTAWDRGVIEDFQTPYSIMDQIRDMEGSFKAAQILMSPLTFLRKHPEFTLLITVPLVIIMMVYAAVIGMAPASWAAWKESVVWGTFLYVFMPMYITALPYTIAFELKERKRRKITKDLSESLRKLSSANDTGQTLLESFKTVAETSTGSLANEFEIIHTKVKMGTSMEGALIEFNNKYQRPRLARTIKLISKAQETSSQIAAVLTTAAEASEQADDMARERVSRSRMQIVIIIMTYITLLIVMIILKTQFLDVMANMANQMGGGGGGGGGVGGVGGGFSGVDVPKLSLLFLHAITLQGMAAAAISGYLRTGQLVNGLKFMMVLPSLALVAWIFV